MSDMSAAVVLKLVDDLSAPARKAHKSLSDLVRGMQKFGKMSFKQNGIGKQISSMTREVEKQAKAVKSLRDLMGKPIANRMGDAAKGFSSITSEANKANAAVQRLNRTMGSTSGSSRGGNGGRTPPPPSYNRGIPNVRLNRYAGANGPWGPYRPPAPPRPPRGSAGGAGRGGGGGGGGGGHGGGSGGFFGGLGHSVASTFAHVGVYEAVHRGIHGTAEMIKGGFEQAFDLEHTKALLTIQGESKESIDQVVAKARQMTKDIPQFTTAQNAAAIAELRPAMIGGLHEAMHLAPQFQQAVGVLEAVKTQKGHSGMAGIDSHGEALDLARAMELKGVMGDGDKAINSYMDGMVKAVVAFNGQITAGDFHAAIKYGRGAARGWSEDFVTQYLPTIMNDIKAKGGAASGAGNALASFSRAVVDRVMTPKAAAEWNDIGLVKNGYLDRDKKGNIKGIKKGGIENWEGAMANPYQWFQETFMPAMRKKNGGKDPKEAELISELGSLFGNRIAQMLATIMAVQKKQIEKDAQNVREAMGINGLQSLYAMDPTTRMQVLAAAFKELGGAIGELGMPGVMRGMKGMIDWAHRAAETVQKSPYAKALGGHFDAAVAGLFGQDGKGFKGRDKGYYDAGKTLSDGFGKYMKSVGETMKWLEEIGVITGAMKALGYSFEVFAAATDLAREGAQLLGPALMDGGKAIVEAFNSVVGWLKGAFSWAFPAEEKKAASGAAKPQPEAQVHPAAKIVGMRAAATQRAFGALTSAPPAFGGAKFGLGGMEGGSSVLAPIAAQANALVPTMATAGSSSMAAMAGGIAQGAATVEAQVAALMASLAAIAASGIKIPITADTSGVAGAVAGAVAAGKGAANVTIHNHINGARDPKATAGEVHAAFKGAVDKHLSDIG